MRAQMILSETATGLRRHLVMSLAIVVTTAISLTFLGASLLFREQVDRAKGYWYDRVELSIFLCPEEEPDPEALVCPAGGVTQEQRDQILGDLRAMPEVEDVQYESQQEAFARFREQFPDSALTDNITPDQLPESYRVALVDPEEFETVAAQFRDRDGVYEVVDQKAVLDQLFRYLNIASLATAVLALIILSTAVIMIALTVQLSAHTRRRETGIMRLVGASRFYIQLPFVLEGALAGLLGAAISAGIIAFPLWYFIIDGVAASNPTFAWIGWEDYVDVLPWLFLVGVGMAGLASFLTSLLYIKE